MTYANGASMRLVGVFGTKRIDVLGLHLAPSSSPHHSPLRDNAYHDMLYDNESIHRNRTEINSSISNDVNVSFPYPQLYKLQPLLRFSILTMTAGQNGVHREPLKATGVLEKFEYEDTTPVIGREFPKLNIVNDVLGASNADELLRDLAITSTLILKYLHQISDTGSLTEQSLRTRRSLLPRPG